MLLLVPAVDDELTTTTTLVPADAGGDDPLDEETLVWLIVGGLVLVAVLIAVWTARFWARTRPVREPSPDQ